MKVKKNMSKVDFGHNVQDQFSGKTSGFRPEVESSILLSCLWGYILVSTGFGIPYLQVDGNFIAKFKNKR